MKALIVTGSGKFGIQEIADPRPGPFDCLVKIDACAVCTGTDSNVIAGAFAPIEPWPFLLGHESTGVIVETGAGVVNFQKGQRVTRPAGILAGTVVNGIHSNWGGYAEWGLVRDVRAARAAGVKSDGMLEASCNPIPIEVDPIDAALSINQREILSVVMKMPLLQSSTVCIIGSGYNGLLFSLFCKHFGAGKVVISGNPRVATLARERFGAGDFVDYRDAEAAQQVRAALGSEPTHVIDAVGSMASLEFAGQVAGRRTRFGCYGMDEVRRTGALRSSLAKKFPPLDMSTNEAGCVNEWYELWRGGFFMNPGMYDLAMPFAQAHEAFEILGRREAVKIVLEM